MPGKCEIGDHLTLKSTGLYWGCRDCVEAARRNATVTEIVEVPRKRQVAPFVLPVAGILFVLAIVSEILAYWH